MVSDRVMALNYGKVIALGTPDEVQSHPEVVRAYIGGERMSACPQPLLDVTAIETFYGPIQAIRGVSLQVAQGQIVTVLGANGAGKTTVLRTISGVLDPERGQVRVRGQEIAHMPPDRVMRLGICHVPGRPRGVPVPDRAREPADGCLLAPRQGRGAPRSRALLQLFPAA